MSARIHINPASLILAVFAIGASIWGIMQYKESKRLEAEERAKAEKKAQEEADEKARLAREKEQKEERERLERDAEHKRQAEADRKARIEAERIRAEAAKAKAEAEMERQRIAAEEQRRKEEAAAAQRKIDEEARKRAEDERRLLEAQKAEENRSSSIAAAQKDLSDVRTERRDAEKKKAEADRNITAANNRIATCEKQMAVAIEKARQWAQEQGVVFDSTNPWNVQRDTSNDANTAGIKIVQNNQEQIQKEKANYDRAEREVNTMRALQQKSTMDSSECERLLQALLLREKTALDTLTKFGVDPNTKTAAAPEASASAESKTIRMKDGSTIDAQKVVDGGDVYSVKTAEGKFVTLKKTDVAEVPQSLLPKK